MKKNERAKFEGNIASFERVVEELREQNRQLQVAREEWQLAQASLELSHRFLEIANRHTEKKLLFKDIVVEAQRLSSCQGVGLRIMDDEGNIPYVAYAGFSQSFYELESPLSTKSDQCMCINVIKGTTNPALSFYTPGGSFYMNGTTRFLATVSEEDKGSSRNVCNNVGYESVALLPMRVGERIVGLLHLADPRENMVPLALVEILEQAIQQLGPALKRILIEEELKNYADKQGVLVQEVNHRVKNNLAAILSMLHIEEERAEREGIVSFLPLLQSLAGRIDGLLTVHRLLSSSSWQPLDLGDLCEKLIGAAFRTLPGGENGVFTISPSDIKVDSNQAHHLALVINELASNSCKHVFEQRLGNLLRVTISRVESRGESGKQLGHKKISICFIDNGPGYPEHILKENGAGVTGGLELVYGIVTKSLAGQVRFENDAGAKTTIIF